MDEFKRRKVKYRLSDIPDFDPDMSDNERRENENLYHEKDGWWHAWTEVSEFDNKSDKILIATYGVIETQDGNLLELPIKWFRFTDNE